MRQAVAVNVRRPSVARGWTILGLAAASWALLFVGSQIVGTLFNSISSSL
ncbi:MAG: hypothetical protein ACOH2M_09275 [Cypionkella sp.]